VAEYGTARRPRRRGRGLLIGLIVLLVIIGIVLFVGDRVGRSYAERIISDKVAEQVSNQKATSEKPDVTIEGFPADQNGTKKIKLPLLDIRARDVKASIDTLRSGGNIVAGTVTGTGTLDYKQLASLVDQPGLTLTEKNGQLTGAAKVQALGQSLNVTGVAKLTVSDGVVHVRFANVDSPDLPNIPGIKALVAGYADKLGIDVQVPALPLKLKVQKVQPQADGLQFTAGATNVTLNSSGV
jgi:hypothetical protein